MLAVRQLPPSTKSLLQNQRMLLSLQLIGTLLVLQIIGLMKIQWLIVPYITKKKGTTWAQ